MRKTLKIWVIIAASLILLGSTIFWGVMATLKWDFSKLSTAKYETNHYEINEQFKAVSVNTNTADIVFIPSEKATCSVVCYEQKKMKHTVTIEKDTLVIEVVDTRKWYEYIGIDFRTSKITIYLPKGEYGALSIKSDTGDVEIPKDFQFESIDISESTGDVKNYASASGALKIKTSTGNIRVENISASSLDLSVSTGKVTVLNVTCEGDVAVGVSTGKAYLTDITCKNVISKGDTGDISLKNVIATEKFSIKRDTGDVKFDGCDAAEIFVKTSTGDIKGSFLTNKVFIIKSDTGSVKVPDSVTGGRCEISTDTGNIKLQIIEN